jgi:hypothetical protein
MTDVEKRKAAASLMREDPDWGEYMATLAKAISKDVLACREPSPIQLPRFDWKKLK